MKSWRVGDCDNGGDEWTEEVELTKQTVEAVNRLRPRPRFMVLCGDLVHAMPGKGVIIHYNISNTQGTFIIIIIRFPAISSGLFCQRL